MAKPNGCGSGWNEWLVPDWIFVKACETHDIGYAICGASKVAVDNQFLNDMCQACIGEYPTNEFKRLNCITVDRKYYDAVVSWGNGAFNDAQKKACKRDEKQKKKADIKMPRVNRNGTMEGYGSK